MRAVSRHIEVAERYLNRGRVEREDDLFNDVIYRTNQAFEGMLKEAYTVLTDQDGSKVTPFEIESHLLKASVFGSRVMDLFTNYRKNWRNPSTHDHKFVVTEQEALLAIVSVSAFTSILIDQIVEKVNKKREQEAVQSRKADLENKLKEQGDSSFSEALVNLLEVFNYDLLDSKVDVAKLSEIEILGRLTGFLEALNPGIEVKRQAKIRNTRMRPDLIVTGGTESVVIEVKRPGTKLMSADSAIHQMIAYLHAGSLRFGIIFVPASAKQMLQRSDVKAFVGSGEATIRLLMPRI